MALTISQLFAPVQLGLTSAVIYAQPAGSVLKNGRVRLTNTSILPVAATLYAAPSATTSAAANCFLSAVSISANAFLDVDIPTLTGGDTLRGLAGTATVITVHEMGGVSYS